MSIFTALFNYLSMVVSFVVRLLFGVTSLSQKPEAIEVPAEKENSAVSNAEATVVASKTQMVAPAKVKTAAEVVAEMLAEGEDLDCIELEDDEGEKVARTSNTKVPLRPTFVPHSKMLSSKDQRAYSKTQKIKP